jgi:dihydrofolate reductase
MGKLIYGTNISLDGYIEDPSGRFDWSEPDDEVHAFINDVYRPLGTFIHGRRMYETMAVWETEESLATSSDIAADFAAIWGGADKVVYSATLTATWTNRTRLEPRFDPDALHELKESSSADIGIGGAEIAALAFAEGLVDEVRAFVLPVVVGGGKPAFTVPRRLDLIESRSLSGGWLYTRYRVTP